MPRDAVRACVMGLNSLRMPSLRGARILVAPAKRDAPRREPQHVRPNTDDAPRREQQHVRPNTREDGPAVLDMKKQRCDESTPAESSTAVPERKRARIREEDAVVALQALALVRAQQLQSASLECDHDADVEPLWTALEREADIDWKSTDALCKALSSYCLARRIPPWVHHAAHGTLSLQAGSLWDVARILYYTTVLGWTEMCSTNSILRLLSILQSSTEHLEPKKASQLAGYVAFVAAVHRNEGLLDALATWMRESGATLCFFDDRWRLASAVCALSVHRPEFHLSVDLAVSNTKDIISDDDKTAAVAEMYRDVGATISNVLSASRTIRQQTAVLYHLDLVIPPER
eukprot:GEMP01015884.1.p2 GENE.GEMP01015884.1~~GEMP01015884.1.p2  ORF type:complete len:347 (+),score=107.65 GEMP01015884.1:1224-2264(+)